MNCRYFIKIFIVCIVIFLPLSVTAQVLTQDVTWQGEMVMDEDVLIPAGVTLTISPNTLVKVKPSDSTKIDPEYLSHRTELLVRGKLKILGRPEKKVVFELVQSESRAERWAGIIVNGGNVEGIHFAIRGAESAISVQQGDVDIRFGEISFNRYGVTGQGPKSRISLQKTRITDNEFGIVAFNGAIVSKDQILIRDNDKKDVFSAQSGPNVMHRKEYMLQSPDITRFYKDEALIGDTIWKGRVRIQGQVRLPPKARLIILPGTVVEFTRKDTNGDGIGENGLQIQGMFIAKGTPDKPIIFRSAEANPAKGDWDALNFLGSYLARNLLEFCQIENAYRGLHFHFSNVAVNHSVLRSNYRGAQFQESLVTIKNTHFYENNSAIQARDSEVIFADNLIYDNINGANLFRLNLKAFRNTFAANNWDGLRIREGACFINHNRMVGNRTGLLVADAVYGDFSSNLLNANLEYGLVARNTANIEFAANVISRNGINGISLKDSRAIISANLISDNGERGIGIVSFTGKVSGNNIAGNGVYGIGIESHNDIQAQGNWWGESDLAREIYDKNDEVDLGHVLFEPVLEKPVVVDWPLKQVESEVIWRGTIAIHGQLTGEKSGIEIKPGTTVLFDKGSGIHLDGGFLKAFGTSEKGILFSALHPEGPKSWGEISVEQLIGGGFSNCDFEYATWGLHVHFSPINITRCRFRQNDGGIRFRSGPVQISKSLFQHNRIGIRAYLAKAEIFDNEFSVNEIGIFVREKGSGLKIYHNNMFANDRYNLRLGDFNQEDVDARHNWWGDKTVLETVFDGRRESYIGNVVFEPVLPAPRKIEGLAPYWSSDNE